MVKKVILIMLMFLIVPFLVGASEIFDNLNGSGYNVTFSNYCNATSCHTISEFLDVGAGGDITAVNTDGRYLTGGDTSGAISLLVNDTVLNESVDSSIDLKVDASFLQNLLDSIYARITYVDTRVDSIVNTTDAIIQSWINSNSTADKAYTDTRVDSIDNHTATVDTVIGNETIRVDLIIGTYIPNNATADRVYTDIRVDSIDNHTATVDTSIGNESVKVALIIGTYIPNNATADRSYTDTRVDSIVNLTESDVEGFFSSGDGNITYLNGVYTLIKLNLEQFTHPGWITAAVAALDNFFSKTETNALLADINNTIDTKLDITDQRYNDTAINTSDNINTLFPGNDLTTDIDTTIGNESANVALIIGTYIPDNSTANRAYTDTRVDSIDNHTATIDTNTQRKGDDIYLYNDSTTMILNESKLNLTIDERVSVAGGGDITEVNTQDTYISGGETTGAVNLAFNETKLNMTTNASIDLRVGAGDGNFTVTLGKIFLAFVDLAQLDNSNSVFITAAVAALDNFFTKTEVTSSFDALPNVTMQQINDSFENWSQAKSSYWDTSNDLDTVIGADEIAEANIAFSTACSAGDFYRLTGNDLECTTPTDTTYANGSGLTLVGTEFNHSDTSSQASDDNSGNTFIQDIVLDTFGHITSITNAAVSFASYWDTSNDLDTVIGADEIAEANIAFSTACSAGNHYYLNGNDLACEADDDTTYSALSEFANDIGAITNSSDGNMSVAIVDYIKFHNDTTHSIESNTTCVIIKGDTAELHVC